MNAVDIQMRGAFGNGYTMWKQSIFQMIISTVSGFVYLMLNAPTLVCGSDQLNQIEGALNLYTGHGYVLNDGSSVRYWPPLYAMYVSIFFNASDKFWTVALSNAALISVTSFSWCSFIFFFSKTFSDNTERKWRFLTSAIISIGASETLVQLYCEHALSSTLCLHYFYRYFSDL